MKKIISIILPVIILISSLPVGVFAEDVTDENEQEIKIVHKEYFRDENGLDYKVFYDENGNVTEYENQIFSTQSAVNIPEAYDAREDGKITEVKDQGDYGTCWAFAFCSAAESSLISQGYGTKDNIDLSEAHLAWFREQNYVENSSDPAQKDRVCLDDTTFDYGGHIYDASATVTRWSGFASEKDFPYSPYDCEEMMFDQSEMYANNYNLTSMKVYYNNEFNEIKEAILRNGALYVSFYYSSDNIFYSDDGWCYYQNDECGSNHAVSVVGWDDNFSAENFWWNVPEEDGAWLIKNSWGTDSWCSDDGYFWISYCDTSLSDFTEVNAKPAGDYDNNYQYDGIYCFDSIYSDDTLYGANIFTANGTEKIKGSGFNIYNNAPTKCTVSVYTGLKDKSKPTSGVLRGSKTINTSHEGFYTVDFDEEYSVKPGEKFSVVLKLESLSDDCVYLQVESPWCSSYSYSSEKNQSFYSTNGKRWNDTERKDLGNIALKAYTVNCSENDVDEPIIDDPSPVAPEHEDNVIRYLFNAFINYFRNMFGNIRKMLTLNTL